MKNLGILASSANPAQVSKTVAGLIVGASVFIIWAAQTYLHLTLTSDSVSNAAEQIGEVIASLLTLYGLLQKLAISVQQAYVSSKQLDTQ